MKKKFYSCLVLLFLFTRIVLSQQSGWFWQNPLPQGNDLFGLKMFDANNGICVDYDDILKTSNGGENWNIYFTGFNTYNNNACFVDQNTGYILLDTTTLIKTINGGINWSIVHQFNPLYVRCLYFINNTTGFIISNANNFYYNYYGTKLFRTTTGGLYWDLLMNDTNYVLSTMFFPSSQIGYAAGYQMDQYQHSYAKIFKTTNSGITWDSLHLGSTLMNISCMFFINDNEGYVGCPINQQAVDSVYKTVNGGLNWFAINYSFNDKINVIKFINQNTGFIFSNQGVAYNYLSFYKTTNSGNNWSSIYFSDFSAITDLSFIDQNTGIGVGSLGIIIKTTNTGNNWISKSKGTYRSFNDVRFSDLNTGFVSSDEPGILLRTINGGNNWDTVLVDSVFGYGGLEAISNVGNNIWYVAQWHDGKIYKTTNTGSSWDTLYTNLYGITCLKFINANTGFGICKYNYFFKTTNGGQNWIELNNLGSQNWAMDFVNENTGYVGSGEKTFKTTNGGSSWDTLSINMPANAIQFVNNNTGYVGVYTNSECNGYICSYIEKTTNSGNSWYSYFLSNSYVEDIFFVNERLGFACCDDGTYKTFNGGINWYQIRTCKQYNTGGAIFFIDSLTGWIVGAGGAIIKTTNGGGLPIGIQPISKSIPSKFILYQNYPNPFNPTTKINFSLPLTKGVGGMFVKLIIYDILGREVAVLINEKLQPGSHEVTWDGTKYASGVYFYQLKAGDYSETKKMVLLK